MSPRPKKAKASKEGVSAKVTVYVACIAFVGAIAAAVISNSDKIFGKKEPSQIEAIKLLQEVRYDEVLRTLDSQSSALQRYRESPLEAPLSFTTSADSAKPSPTPTQRRISAEHYGKITLYLQSNNETRRAIEAKHRDLLSAVQAGDNLKSMSLKTDVSQLLAEDWRRFTILIKELGLEWPRPTQGMYMIRTSPEPRESP